MTWPVSAFPAALDTIVDKVDSIDYPLAADVNGAYDCIEKLEAKVGVDDSAVTSSLDYLVKAGTDPGHTHTGIAALSTFLTNLTGAIAMWPTETPPTGWLECNGASISRTTYSALFAVIGCAYGTFSISTFNLPDLRGKFVRAWDNARGVDVDAATRTAVTAVGATMVAGDHVGTEQADDHKSHTHSVPAAVAAHAQYGDGDNISFLSPGATQVTGATPTPTDGKETRPVNVNMMFIIKT